MSDSSSVDTSSAKSQALSLAYAILSIGCLQVLYRASLEAYRIRLFAVEEYGRIIHEFDPYFNYRATVFLYENGWERFSKWFDYLSWYPLGRPVGTTIYPGMQVTSVLIKKFVLTDWSINDICVFVPAWFGVSATLGVAWLTYICSIDSGCILNDIPGVKQAYSLLLKPVVNILTKAIEFVIPSSSAWGLRPQHRSPLAPAISAVSAACIMSVLPAHLLRSVAGGYDNESIAMTAMVVTFACWTSSLRIFGNLFLTTAMGTLTGLAYFYMVAAWGGYVFVINLMAAHAGALVLLGRYSDRLHRAYTSMFVIGTALAIHVPVVGLTPLKSLEQMGPLVAFGGLQLIEVIEMLKRTYNWDTKKTWQARFAAFGGCGIVAILVAFLLASKGYFGPISSRVRGLFVKHTKTGNPLVDSVAEHQAASSSAYFQYLHFVCYLLPIGSAWTLFRGFGDSSSFLVVYGVAAYYFSLKMVRLILLTAPIASCLGGIAVGRVFTYGVNAVLLWDDVPREEASETSKKVKKAAPGKKRENKRASGIPDSREHKTNSTAVAFSFMLRIARLALLAHLVYRYKDKAAEFYNRCQEVAQSISHPTIVQKGRTNNGDVVTIDDYREAYTWLGENTETDARIMAWWDYGYQITGIANRTTLADGNTWNHEHIALLGRILTAPEKEAHRIARHLADYVLVWAGGGGDDLAKSPHLRRIANSVYRGLCREPTCDRSPTESMKGSLLFKLHSNGLAEGVEVDRNRFREVFRSKYRKVRIYKILSVSKESKDWVQRNRECDAGGSWFCPGKYPPALGPILEQKSDFAQLEDFNRGGAGDDQYTKEYFENLEKKTHGQAPPQKTDTKKSLRKLTDAKVTELNEVTRWGNTETTTRLFQAISENNLAALRDICIEDPRAPHARSEDGRGPMWWAHEFKRDKAVEFLKKLGVSDKLLDINGVSALDMRDKEQS